MTRGGHDAAMSAPVNPVGRSPACRLHASRAGTTLRASGLAILLIEQKLTIALRTAHRVYVMGHGKIVYEDTSDDLAAAADIRKEWLEA
jgi:branched-chain amino acid transport system ATP-binding protein